MEGLDQNLGGFNGFFLRMVSRMNSINWTYLDSSSLVLGLHVPLWSGSVVQNTFGLGFCFLMLPKRLKLQRYGLMLHLLSQVSQDGIPSFPNGIVWTTNIAQGAPQVSLNSAFL